MKLEPWEEDLRGDPADWVKVKARKAKQARAVYSIRLTRSELGAICAAARSHGLRPTEFIRRAAIRATSDTSMTEGSVAIWRTH